MANGKNEPIEFTRGDAERLRTIEVTQESLHEKLDIVIDKFDHFVTSHQEQHFELNRRIASNSRFRKTLIKVALWIFTAGGSMSLLTVGARAIGWLN